MTTLRELRSRQAAQREAAVIKALGELTVYARAHGGRFLLFGSTAKGTASVFSDVDLIADFGEHADSRRAASASEEILSRYDLVADVRPITYCSKEFLEEIRRDAKVIG